MDSREQGPARTGQHVRMTMTSHHLDDDEDDRWAFTQPPPELAPTDRLRGSAAILRHVMGAYPDREVGPGVLVAVLLDRHSNLIGQGRLRGLPDDLGLPPPDRADLLRDLLHGLQTSDPRGGTGFACLLIAVRDGPDAVRDADLGWWTTLRIACRSVGLHAADVLVTTPAGWFTVRAGTSGPGDWPPDVMAGHAAARVSERPP